MRLFVALALPDMVANALLLLERGIPGARWMTREQLHLTLRLIGEVDGRDAAAIDDALAAIAAPAFTLSLKGVGEFGGKSPHALWVGGEANEALNHLQRKIETALQRIGLPAETRKFTPHITLARLKAAPRERLMHFLTDNALYRSAPFEANEFTLFSSVLTSDGSHYTPERVYPLQ